MDFTQICNAADVIQNVFNIAMCQPKLAPQTLRCILILKDQWYRYADLKPLRVNMCETLDCMKFTEQGERGI